MKKLNTEMLISKFQEKHPLDNYDYSKVIYVAYKSKVIIICNKLHRNGELHGDFEQRPADHIRGSGCPICFGGEILTNELIDRKLLLKNIPIKRLGNVINSKTAILWKCLNIECNNEWKTNPTNILCDSKETGCRECISRKMRIERKGQGNPNFKGLKDLHMNQFNRIRDCAELRNIKFDITIEDILYLFEKQNRKCALSGIDIFIGSMKNRTASLDRIDSSKGYEISNVQWVHKNLNLMKRSLSNEEFIKLCELVYKNNMEKLNVKV